MKQIPKYVEKMLQRRQRLAEQLADVSCNIDAYCESIGIDMTSYDVVENGALATDIKIYCEPSVAYRLTKKLIENHLNEKIADV